MAKPSPSSQSQTILDSWDKSIGVLSRSDVDLNLLKQWQDPDYSRHMRIAVGLSVLVHFGLFLAAIQLPTLVRRQDLPPRVIVNRTPLYFPKELTQKEANKNKISERFDLQDLLSQRGAQPQTPSRAHRRFNPKAGRPVPQVQLRRIQPQITADAPPVVAQNNAQPPPGAPGGIIAATAPPPPKPVESPFESIGAAPLPNPHSAMAPPKADVEDVVRGLTHNSRGAQLTVGDDSMGQNLPAVPGTKPVPGRLGSQVELKSDPQGVDLRPYLAQILAIVRSNWFSVLPESVRMGTRRGRTVVQFALNRDGSLAKVVISDYSGSDSLDRAAVAGLSMSNPFPPLPKDYQGAQMKLAFSFNYNQNGATLR
jgi:TonB family protein